jgi:nitronate monooxygenase
VSDRAGCPPRYAARTQRNRFTDNWKGREAALESDQRALGEFRATADRGDRGYLPTWAGEGVDLIAELDSARPRRANSRPCRAHYHRDGKHRPGIAC